MHDQIYGEMPLYTGTGCPYDQELHACSIHSLTLNETEASLKFELDNRTLVWVMENTRAESSLKQQSWLKLQRGTHEILNDLRES